MFSETKEQQGNWIFATQKKNERKEEEMFIYEEQNMNKFSCKTHLRKANANKRWITQKILEVFFFRSMCLRQNL